jgi:hypothetical protein
VPRIDRTLPEVMVQLNAIGYDYDDGDGIDFEPNDEFLSEAETREWFRAWTGNKSVDGSEFLVFGQDGSGGYAAFWCVRPDAGVLDQPVVFLGSEGEVGVLARSFGDYLWLLAAGFGPYEALAWPDLEKPAHPQFTAFATANSGTPRKTVAEVLAIALAEFPAFEDGIQAVCE